MHMDTTIQNLLFLVIAGSLLVVSFFLLRLILKLAWKLVRVALIAISLFLIAGYFFGFLNIFIP